MVSDSHAIDARNVRVDYGDFTAVRDVDFVIPRGEVFGLIGPNGAGKTSAIRVLSTLMEPTHGRVSIDGFDIEHQTAEARKRIGYLPDLAPLIPDLKVWELLDHFAAAYGLRGKERQDRVRECIDKVKMTKSWETKCKALSRGMTQRVGLAKTLLHRPTVLLLDEPASGMDPVSRIELSNTLRELASEGVTVLVSSHILTELSEMCTSVGIMHKGQLVAQGEMNEIVSRMSKTQAGLRIELTEPRPEIAAFFQSREQVSDVQVDGSRINLTFAGQPNDAATLLREIVEAGYPVIHYSKTEGNIGDVLIALEEEEPA